MSEPKPESKPDPKLSDINVSNISTAKTDEIYPKNSVETQPLLKSESLKNISIENSTEKKPVEKIIIIKQESKKPEEIKHKSKYIIKRLDNNLKLRKENFKIENIDIKKIDTKKIRNGDKKMGEEQQIDIDALVNEKINKKISEMEFNKNIKHMHDKIEKIDTQLCEDGRCTKESLLKLEDKVKRLGDLDKLDKLKDLDKLGELDSIKKTTDDINSKIKKIEICPDCGEQKLPYLASYCPECGSEIRKWFEDDNVTPVKGWKPFKERFKK